MIAKQINMKNNGLLLISSNHMWKKYKMKSFFFSFANSNQTDNRREFLFLSILYKNHSVKLWVIMWFWLVWTWPISYLWAPALALLIYEKREHNARVCDVNMAMILLLFILIGLKYVNWEKPKRNKTIEFIISHLFNLLLNRP